MDADRLAYLARLSEDALRAAALSAPPDAADALIDRAGERASQVEQLRAFERPQGATARALPPEPHVAHGVAEAEAALGAACNDALEDRQLDLSARALLASIAASCR